MFWMCVWKGECNEDAVTCVKMDPGQEVIDWSSVLYVAEQGWYVQLGSFSTLWVTLFKCHVSICSIGTPGLEIHLRNT